MDNELLSEDCQCESGAEGRCKAVARRRAARSRFPARGTLRARCIASPRQQVAGCRCRAAALCSGLGPRAASIALTRPLSPVGTEPQMYCQVTSLPWADVGRHDRHSVYSTIKMQAEFEQVCGGVVYDSLVQAGEVKIAYATKIRAQRRSSINLDCITK